MGGSLHPGGFLHLGGILHLGGCIQGGLHPRGEVCIRGSVSRGLGRPPTIGYYGMWSLKGWYASYWNAFLLVSTYVEYGRLSVMASKMWQGKICAQIGKITLFWDLVQNTSPPINWNLDRSWHFEFWLLQTGLHWEYVETNRCIPQGYHLVTEWLSIPYALLATNYALSLWPWPGDLYFNLFIHILFPLK